MNADFEKQLEALLTKYTELLLGTEDPDLQQKVKQWALYTHISKSMPALTKHWNELYPDGKQQMISIISEIKSVNESYRSQKKSSKTEET
ncbi:DUF2573 family protein [Peribacillus deserti]|uniref:DUF2573 domain-containing protein n=1 Tax=Peribacillus deserti TaxID=673318 RepID=A0A2N5M2M3_9BACI|nr:DUF2573 family protein [Peribacillus deserti]PLT28618.1 DUF2573 domain-containing protein [Peribacillus deserti]